MCDEKKLKEKINQIEEKNRSIREELEKKRKLRKLLSQIDELEKEQEDMKYEIENGISKKEKYRKDKEIEELIPSMPHYPSRPKDIWL